MKLYVKQITSIRVEVLDGHGFLVAVFFELPHAMLFCNAMFLTRKVEEVYGIDGKMLMGKLDDLIADQTAA